MTLRGTGLLLAALLPFVLSACTNEKEIRADINNLQAVTIELRRADDANAARLDAISKALAVIESKLKDTPDKSTFEAVSESQLSLLDRVNSAMNEFQNINGRFDENKFQLEKSVKQVSADLELIKSRLDSPEGRVDAQMLQELKARLDVMDADLTVIKGKITIYDEVLARQATAPETAQKPAHKEDPKLLYDKALKEFNDKHYTDARATLKDFIKLNPTDKLIPNAQFWIGETFYSEKVYDDAILAYEEVIQKYPANVKVPDAMLKQAYAFMQIGDKKAARGILGALIDKFPHHKLADVARKKLDAIK